MTGKFPSWCCQICGDPVGWLGRIFQFLHVPIHRCDKPGRYLVDREGVVYPPITEVRLLARFRWPR
jgi:hypothetical protein